MFLYDKKEVSVMRINPQVLRHEMINRCMTGRDFSKFTGISEATLNGLLNHNREPRMSTIGKLAKALGLKPMELILQE